MAKKKAAKKKAVKKKAVKKQAGKKKAAAKAHQKKSGPKAGHAADAPVSEIRYQCGPSCTASTKFAHLTPGGTVDLVAVNTTVTIDFQHGSPFVPPTNPIHIAQGTRVQMNVGNFGVNPRHFDYVLTCKNPPCRTSTTNPEMIVP